MKKRIRVELLEPRRLLTAIALPPEVTWNPQLQSAASQLIANVASQPAPTQWVIGLGQAGSIASVAQPLGLEVLGPTGIIANAYAVQLPRAGSLSAAANQASEISQILRKLPGVTFAFPLIEREYQERLIPNDSLFSDQWHLNNTGQFGGVSGEDVNITQAWDNFTGNGVVIGIVDDGLEHSHSDLSGNYRADLSFDFNNNDPDPTPDTSFDAHGTSVAGVAAAVGNNQTGVTGAAFGAQLAGLRLISGPVTDLTEANALSHASQSIDIYSNSWGPFDDGFRLEGPGPLTLAAMQQSATSGRGGRGNIYVWAGGNGGTGDNVNYDGYANSRYTIAVGAVTDSGLQAPYSESGASLLIAAPSNGGNASITTTTVGNSYTSSFGGTSSATPLVAGVIALALEANPGLSWRDVQHLLVHSARMNDATDPGWTINGAGHAINHKYGYGVIDAAALVTAAGTWVNVGPEASASSGVINVGQSIPDGSPTGVSSTFTVNDPLRLESVEVILDAPHTSRGQLEVVLTSPAGTESILAQTHGDSGNNYANWTFTTVRHWDELAPGDWTLTVRDPLGGETGTLNSWQLNLFGTPAGDIEGPLENFTPRSPLGSQVYRQKVVAGIDPAGETDTFTIELTAGNTFSVALEASAGLAPEVEIRSPAGQPIDSNAAGTGESLLFQMVPAVESGIYEITVSGGGSTADSYSLEVLLNALHEQESFGGNDNFLIPQLLDSQESFGEPGRQAVVGELANGSDTDGYRFVALPGESFSLAASSRNGLGGFQLELYDEASYLLARSEPLAANSEQLIDDFLNTSLATPTQYFVRVVPTGNQSRVNYTLLLASEIAFDRESNNQLAPLAQAIRSPGTGAIGFAVSDPSQPNEQEPNDDGSPGGSASDLPFANNLQGSFQQIAAGTFQAQVTGSISSGSDQDWDFFRLRAQPGDTLTATLVGNTLSDPYLRLYDNTGSQIAFNDDTGGLDSEIVYDEFTYQGDYYLVADSYRTRTGSYVLTATLETDSLSDESIDYYQVRLNTGTPVQVTATAPSSGPGLFENRLQVEVELFDTTGSSVASGVGGLSFNPTTDGLYTIGIRDSAQLASGEYHFSVTGAQGGTVADPPEVASITPANGSATTSTSPLITLRLDQPLRFDSVDAGDLLIGGLPATGVTVNADNSLTFDPGPLSNGFHFVELPAGVVANWQNEGNVSFLSGFTIDSVAPRIIESTLQQNDTLPEGPLSVTLEFDEPLNQAALDPTDVTLSSPIYGTISPDSLSYDPGSLTVSFTFNDILRDDAYELTASSSATGFQDINGNRLDGEAVSFPIGPNVTGNGIAGGDFQVSFEVDLETRPANTPVRLAPSGSLIARSSSNRAAIIRAADSDRFTFDLQAGQTIAARAVPANPQAQLTLQLPGLSSPFAAPGPGEPVLLPMQLWAASGSTNVEVTSDLATGYSLEVVLNAQWELEEADSSSGTPLALDSSRLPGLGGRSAVVGSFPASVPESTDTYTLDLTGQAGTPIDLIFRSVGTESLSEATVELLDPQSNVVATATSTPLGVPSDNVDQSLLDFVLPVEGVYTVRVTSGSASGGDYSLIVFDRGRFEVEPNDSADDPLRELSPSSPTVGYLGAETGDNLNRFDTPFATAGNRLPADQLPYETHAPEPAGSTHRLKESHPLLALPPSTQLHSESGLLTAPSSDDPLSIARQFLSEHAQEFGLTPMGVSQLHVTDQYTSAHTGTTHLYFRQTYDSLPVLNATLNVNISAHGEVINAGGGAVSGLGTAVSRSIVAPELTAVEALQSIASYFEWNQPGTIQSAATAPLKDFGTSLWASKLTAGLIPAALAYAPARGGGVELVWHMNIDLLDGSHWYDAAVSASTGTMLYWNDWVSHATYNVFPLPLESPNFGPRELVVDPDNAVASPFGWHDTNATAGAESTLTIGNNVTAYADRNDDNLIDPGSQPDGSGSLTFDFPLDEAQNPSTFQPAAVTNLFYWNNVIHDVLYQYGFDEAAGNFQTNNYGNGGAGADAVRAEAQDGADIGNANNANFATPPDGSAPRMQMFLFNNPTRDGDLDNGIITHEYGHGVSNRLTGGPANAGALSAAQSGGMGEGWSDWFALLFSQQAADAATDARGMGTYALGQSPAGAGIRTQPYSYDMSVNDLTYGRIATQAPPHGIGEVWSSVLWDLNWLLIEGSNLDSRLPAGLGFDADLYQGTGGNNVALQLVLDGMKLQPANPSFLDARDAILAADQVAFGGAHATHIWLAFARRGMGFSADDGGSANSVNVTEAFDLPATSQGTIELNQEFYQEGDLVEVVLRDSDLSANPTTQVPIQASGGDTELLTLTHQGLGLFTGSIQLASGPPTLDGLLQAAANELLEVFYADADDGTGNPANLTDSARVLEIANLYDFDFSDPAGNASAEGFTTSGSSNQWHLSTGRGTNPGHSPDDSFYFGAGETSAGGGLHLNDANGTLLSPLLDLTNASAPLTLSFNHFLEAEATYDEARVSVVVGGNRTTLLSNFTGTLPNVTGGFVQQTFDLSAYGGEQIQLEFLFDSDFSITNEGWYVDDIQVESVLFDPDLRGPLLANVDPPAGATPRLDIESIDLEFDEALDPLSAQNSANYELLSAGANGTFENGAGDDLLIPTTINVTSPTQVALLIDPTFAPLGPGNYRLTLTGEEAASSLRDLEGNPLGSQFGPGSGEDRVHEFSVVLDTSLGIDRFALPLQAGDTVTLATETTFPASNGQPANDLNPRLVVVNQAGSIVAADTDSADGTNALINFTAESSGSYQVLVVNEGGRGEYLLQTSIASTAAQVVDRQLFYDNSAYDQSTPGTNPADDLALATDLVALREGQTATAANISSYVKGINGIAIDVTNLAQPSNLSLSDFQFQVGNQNSPASWAAAPAPSGLEVRPVAGSAETDRIYLTWNAGEIAHTWLQVTLRATAATGLSADDRFYFGSAPGDADGNGEVDAADFVATRGNPRNFLSPASVSNDFDFNRDRRVNATDLVVVRDHVTDFSSELLLIQPPAPFADSNSSEGEPRSLTTENLLARVDRQLQALDRVFSQERQWL